MARGMAGPSWNQIMMMGGLGLAGIVLYEIYVNQGTIQAAIQNALNPINPYQQQGYYCPGGGVPGPTGLCPNGQPAINQSQFNQIASMAGGCSDGSIVNPSTGRCANGTIPMNTGYGLNGLGYPQTSVCNDGSQPNPINGLCANGSYPTSVGTGVNNSFMNPYGAPQYVQPGITGGVGVPGTTTFTDPTTGQMYDPSTGMLLTPGGSYTTPSLASPYNSIFPYLQPLGQGPVWSPPPSGPNIGVCSDQSTPDAVTGLCANGTQPASSGLGSTPTTPSGHVGCSDGTQPNTQGICANTGLPPGQTGLVGNPTPTQITTANQPPSGTLGCADGSTAGATGLCANGQPPTTSLPVGTNPNPSGQVPVTATPVAGGPTTVTPTPAPTPAPVPVTTTTTTTPLGNAGAPGTGGGGGGGGTTTNTRYSRNRYGGGMTQQQNFGFGGAPGRSGYAGYLSEGAMISAQAFGYQPMDRSRARVTTYSSVRSKAGNSPITNEIFGRRFYTSNPIYVSGIK